MKTLITISIIITLLLGIALGMVLSRKFTSGHKYWITKDITQEKLLSRLSRKLDLTMPQIQAIGGILRMQGVKIKEARDEFRGKLKRIKEETMVKIEPHLTPEQREKYTKLTEMHRKRWERVCKEK